jgi:excisionase family DNA binding protein
VDMSSYLKLPEVAHRLGVSEKTARRYIKSGDLPSVFIGNSYRVEPNALTEFVERSRGQHRRVEEMSGSPKAPSRLSPEAPEDQANEERHGSNDVWRAEYLARGNDMLDKWEDELEEEIALAESDLDHFFEWLQEIREFGNPYINGLISAYAATARSKLEVVAGTAKFLGPYNDLWLRIEKHLDQTTKLSEEDEKRFRELYEEAVAVH